MSHHRVSRTNGVRRVRVWARPCRARWVRHAGGRPRDAVRSVPLAKRPKGRWFISLCLVLLFSTVGYSLWNELWRYQAHGLVDARLVQLTAPAAARVASLHVREGQEVRLGDVLVTLDRPELAQQIARTSDELRVALATVSAAAIRLRWEEDARNISQQQLRVDYYRFVTQLIDAEASWQERSDDLARMRDLCAHGAVAAADVDRLATQVSGLEANIMQLRDAIEELRPTKTPDGLQPPPEPSLGPQLAEVAALRGELGRLREQLLQCELRRALRRCGCASASSGRRDGRGGRSGRRSGSERVRAHRAVCAAALGRYAEDRVPNSSWTSKLHDARSWAVCGRLTRPCNRPPPA